MPKGGQAAARDAERLANIVGRMNALSQQTHNPALRERLRIALQELTRHATIGESVSGLAPGEQIEH